MILVFRLLHIVVGVFWVGSVLFLTLFLTPAARQLGPAAGPLMGYLAGKRRLSQWIIGAGVVTVLSGLGLFRIVSGHMDPTWLHSGMGRTISFGAACAILALAVGIFFSAPTARKMALLMAERAAATQPPTPEQAAELAQLQARAGKFSLLGASLVFVATVAMAVARYI